MHPFKDIKIGLADGIVFIYGNADTGLFINGIFNVAGQFGTFVNILVLGQRLEERRVAEAFQSVENGDKSKEISPKGSIPAPAKSITTVVFLSDTPNSIRTPAASNLVNDQNTTAKVFDLNGNLVWSGNKDQALNADGTLRLNLRQGMYLVKTKNATMKTIKK